VRRLHDVLVEAACFTVGLRGGPVHEAPLPDLTVVVKTFERPAFLRRFVASVRRFYPRLAIIVVDDSRRPQSIAGVEHVVLPFDQGVGRGRNAALARVKTPFFLSCDDDFLFYRRTDLRGPLERMRSQPALDVLGGVRVDLPFGRVVPSAGRRAAGARGPLPTGTLAGLPRREMVAAFFIGRTARVRAIGWDPQLKRLDHADFFGQLRGRLMVVEDPALRVLHARRLVDPAYFAYRGDVEADEAYLQLKWEGAVRRSRRRR
jgi:hypothetical protein